MYAKKRLDKSVCEWAFSLLAIRCLRLPRFESCIQQRKTTCLLSIRISLACARASKLATTNMYKFHMFSQTFAQFSGCSVVKPNWKIWKNFKKDSSYNELFKKSGQLSVKMNLMLLLTIDGLDVSGASTPAIGTKCLLLSGLAQLVTSQIQHIQIRM